MYADSWQDYFPTTREARQAADSHGETAGQARDAELSWMLDRTIAQLDGELPHARPRTGERRQGR